MDPATDITFSDNKWSISAKFKMGQYNEESYATIALDDMKKDMTHLYT